MRLAGRAGALSTLSRATLSLVEETPSGAGGQYAGPWWGLWARK